MQQKSSTSLYKFFLFILILFFPLIVGTDESFELVDLGGVQSPYTDFLKKNIAQLLQEQNLENKIKHEESQSPLDLRCWSTEGDELYIGIEQRMLIHAPLSAVAAVLDDFSHYKDLFPGFAKIYEVSRKDLTILTFWEQIIPVPFVKNIEYEMIYQIHTPTSESRLYRYQLKRPTRLTVSDGFIFLKANSERTHYLELDFFNAQWGMAKVFGARKIWTDALEGLALADLGIKIKSEDKSLPYKKIQGQAKKQFKSSAVKECFQKRKKVDSLHGKII